MLGVTELDQVLLVLLSNGPVIGGVVGCLLDNIHPCEKVIGIFFRHNISTIDFLLFALVFMLNICEVLNINSGEFCWNPIISYTSVTFLKRLFVQNTMSH